FGRLDLVEGSTMHVGRLGVSDEESGSLVTDWRAPAASAFYQATAQEPMGVLRRRVIRCAGETVTDIDDEPLTPEAIPEGMLVIGPSPHFTSYISRVLPSMGETSAELRSLG